MNRNLDVLWEILQALLTHDTPSARMTTQSLLVPNLPPADRKAALAAMHNYHRLRSQMQLVRRALEGVLHGGRST